MSARDTDPRLRDAAARDARTDDRHHIDPDASPDVIESQIDAKRADISRTLSQLEQRFSPNQVMDYVRDNGGEVAENLGRSFKRNPVPFIFTGIGLAWLMSTSRDASSQDDEANYRRYRSNYYGGGRDRDGSSGRPAYLDDHSDGYRDDYDFDRYDRDAYSGGGTRADAVAAFGDDVSDTTPYSSRQAGYAGGTTGGGTTGGTGGAMGDDSGDDGPSLLDKARMKASEIGDSVSEGIDSMKEGAGSGRDRASEHYERMRTDARYRADTFRRDSARRYEAMRRSGRDYGQRARRGAEQASDYLQEQPLVAAAVGIAVGALIGSLLPATRTEDRYLGEYADDFRDEASQIAAERGEQVRDKAVGVMHDVTDSATRGIEQARKQAEEGMKQARETAEGDVDRADAKADEKGEQAQAKVDDETTTGGSSTTG